MGLLKALWAKPVAGAVVVAVVVNGFSGALEVKAVELLGGKAVELLEVKAVELLEVKVVELLEVTVVELLEVKVVVITPLSSFRDENKTVLLKSTLKACSSTSVTLPAAGAVHCALKGVSSSGVT